MFVVCVEFQLHEGCAGEFLPLMKQQAENSLLLEEDCLRFDVLGSSTQEGLVFLYEIYTSQTAFKNHLDSQHFQTFDAATSALVKFKSVSTYDRLYSPELG